MIAFGCAITDEATYDSVARPGIERTSEADTVVLTNRSNDSLTGAYNTLLGEAAALDGLEALVLLHQDVEIIDPQFAQKLREVLADPDVGVVGSVGAVDVRSMAWWEATVTWASFVHRYPEYGGGEITAFGMGTDGQPMPPQARTGEVDTLDGFIMCLSPWTVQNIRFDESIGRFHGYDFDFCQQVRAAGKKAIATDLKVVHHHSLELIGDPEAWIEAYTKLLEKWEGRAAQIPAFAGDWRARAYRAEAEAAAARTERVAISVAGDIRVEVVQRELDELRASTSWRVTAPLRRLSQLARDKRQQRTRRAR